MCVYVCVCMCLCTHACAHVHMWVAEDAAGLCMRVQVLVCTCSHTEGAPSMFAEFLSTGAKPKLKVMFL